MSQQYQVNHLSQNGEMMRIHTQRLGLVDERDDSRVDEELRDIFGWAVNDGGISSQGVVSVADRQP